MACQISLSGCCRCDYRSAKRDRLCPGPETGINLHPDSKRSPDPDEQAKRKAIDDAYKSTMEKLPDQEKLNDPGDRYKACPQRTRLARQRSASFFPGVEAAFDMASRSEAGVLRRLHRHGRTLAKSAVEQKTLAGRFGKLAQHAAFADVLLQGRVGYMQ